MQSRRDGGKIRLCQPSLRDCSSFRIPPQDYVPQALTCLECFFSKLPQNRHPERSASQIYRGKPCLMARSRRTPRMPILPMPFGAFQPPKPAPVGPATVFPWGREQDLLASCHVRQLHLHCRQPYRHALHWRHQQPISARHAHKEGTWEGFTAAYGCKRLLYFEGYEDIRNYSA